MSTQAELFHRPSRTGRTYWGPGDVYTFLVTGEESEGAYFAMEAIVPPGGGPPPHIHTKEDETFYILEGECEIRLGDETVTAGLGDFVNVPRGQVHSFYNATSAVVRTCVPPQSSRDTPSTSTTRTSSPYFSPKSIIAPSFRASAIGTM